jgi:chromosome segregation ATPase
MIHKKTHSKSTVSQSEVYNTDLEKLVETLQDKLEGAEIRVEHLKQRIADLHVLCFKVSLSISGKDHDVAYFNTHAEAEECIRHHVISKNENTVTDAEYVKYHFDIQTRSPRSCIQDWFIMAIHFKQQLPKHHLNGWVYTGAGIRR